MILMSPQVADVVRSLAMVQLAIAAASTAIFATFKRQYYTTARSAIRVIALGIITIFASLTWGLWLRMGEVVQPSVFGLFVGALILDVGIFWAFKNNKFHL